MIPRRSAAHLAVLLLAWTGAVSWTLFVFAQGEHERTPARSAAGEIRRTIEAAADGVVEIHNLSGSVVVGAWDRDAVEVVGSFGRAVDALTVERRGDRVVVSVARHLGRVASAHLEMRVPRGSDVEMEGVQTDVTVQGVEGEIDVRVTAGTIRVGGAGPTAGRITLESLSGVLAFDGVGSRARLSTISGPIHVRGSLRSLTAETVNGPVDLELEGLDDARLETVAGPVLARLAPRAGAQVEISSFSGEIELALDPAQALEVYATTRSGRFSEEITGDAEIDEEAAGQTLRLRLGSEETAPARIELRSFRGDVRLVARGEGSLSL